MMAMRIGPPTPPPATFVRACLIETVREPDPVKLGTPNSCIALQLLVRAHIPPDESDVARPQYRLLATEDMPLSNSHGHRKIGYKTKVLQTEF